MNLIGLIPGFDSPTMFVPVPFGLAVATFVFYHGTGLRANGAGYIKQFLGPFLIMIPLMLPIELLSHFARPLSLQHGSADVRITLVSGFESEVLLRRFLQLRIGGLIENGRGTKGRM